MDDVLIYRGYRSTRVKEGRCGHIERPRDRYPLALQFLPPSIGNSYTDW